MLLRGITRGAVLTGKDHYGLLNTDSVLTMVEDWKNYLLETQLHSIDEFAKHESTERQLGNEHFIEIAESLLGLNLMKNKPGPKVKNDN